MEMNFASPGKQHSNCAMLFRSIQSNESRLASSIRSNSHDLSDYSYTYSTLTSNDNSEEFKPLVHTLIRGGPVRRTGPISERKLNAANESAKYEDELTLSDVPLVPTLEHGSAVRIHGGETSMQSFCTSIKSDVQEYSDSLDFSNDELEASVDVKRPTRRVGPSERVRLPASNIDVAQASFDAEFDTPNKHTPLMPEVVANMVKRLRCNPTDVDLEALDKIDWQDSKVQYQIAPLQRICVLMRKNTRTVQGANRKQLPTLHHVMETAEEQPVTEVISDSEVARVVGEALTTFDKRVAEANLITYISAEGTIRNSVTGAQPRVVKSRTRMRESGRPERPASTVATSVHLHRTGSRMMRSSCHNLSTIRQSTMSEKERHEPVEKFVGDHTDPYTADHTVTANAEEGAAPHDSATTRASKHKKSANRTKLESSMSLVEMKRKNETAIRSSCSRLPAPRQSMMSEQEFAVNQDESSDECEVVFASHQARENADQVSGMAADQTGACAHRSHMKQSPSRQTTSTMQRAEQARVSVSRVPTVVSRSAPSTAHTGVTRTHHQDARRRRKNLDVSRSCSFSTVEIEEVQGIVEKNVELPQTNISFPVAPSSVAGGVSSLRRRTVTAKTVNADHNAVMATLEGAVNGTHGTLTGAAGERHSKHTRMAADNAVTSAPMSTNSYDKHKNSTVPDTVTRLYRRRKVRRHNARICEVSISKLDDMHGDEIVETGTEKLRSEVTAKSTKPDLTMTPPIQRHLASHNRTDGGTAKEHKHRAARATNVHFVSPDEEKVDIVQRTVCVTGVKSESVAHRKRRKANFRPKQEISISLLPENIAGEIVESDTNRLDEQ